MSPSRRRHLERGNTTEAVILIPVVLGVIFVIIQAGIWAHARGVAAHAAREGALSAAAYQAPDTAIATTRQTLAQSGDHLVTSYHVDASSSAQTITVTVHARALSLVPGVQMPQIHQTVSIPREAYTP